MKRHIILLVLLLLTSITPIHATQPVRVIIAAPEEMGNFIKEMNISLQENHPEIQMELWSDSNDSLISALNANDENTPDIVFLDKQTLPIFAGTNLLTDLRPAPYRAILIKQHMAWHAWAQSELFSGRRIIGIPLRSGPRCAYWRRDIFKEVGSDPASIQTMDDLYKAAGEITLDRDGDGKIDRWFTDSATEIAWMIIDSSYQRFYGGKGDTLVESNRFQEAFRWALRFHKAGYTANIETGSSQWMNTIINGKVAYLIADDTMGEYLRGLSPGKFGIWGISRCPSLSADTKPMASMAQGWWLCIPQKAKNKTVAWRVVKYLATDPRAIMAFSRKTRSIPAYMKVWDDPYFSETMDFFDGQQPRLLWMEISKKIPSTRTYYYDGIASNVIASELNQVLNDNKPIKNKTDL
jgi:ABC-type glycerol-3-phosphate transport system substrate-binding protein